MADLRTSPPTVAVAPAVEAPVNTWMNWAGQLKRGVDLASAEAAVRDAATNWDITPFQRSESLSKDLADLLGNLGGDAAAVLRRSVSQVFAAFFPEGVEPTSATRPIAAVLFLLIAMDDTLSRADLNLLAQLLAHLLALGLSGDDYVSLVGISKMSRLESDPIHICPGASISAKRWRSHPVRRRRRVMPVCGSSSRS